MNAVPEELGEFAIEGELGSGGSGIVYAARWQGQVVALKVLRPEEAGDAKERDRFLGEARMLAKVRHPNVVRVFATGTLPDGRPYLAMERLVGSSLAERLLMGRMAIGQALDLFDQVAAAVAALHAAGVVHRDIKPENIMMVDGGQRAVLLDFGIARGVDDAMSTTTQMGLQRGTPAYMAPERFFGARATIGSDVYETAVVLFVMLTGQLPWRDPKSPHDRLEPRTPAALGVDLPPALEQELMRALVPKPEGRPASVDELASAIRRHAWDGDTVKHASPATQPGATPLAATTHVVRRPLVIGGAVMVAAAIAAVAAVLVIGGGGGGGGKPAPQVAIDAAPVVDRAPDRAGAPSGPAPLEVVEVAVDAAPPMIDAAAPPAHHTSAPKSSVPPHAPPTSAAASASNPMPACEKLTAMYCTDEFEATEGGMKGSQCTAMKKVLAQFQALPPDARTDQEAWCAQSYPQMSAAVAERLRQWKAGLGPH